MVGKYGEELRTNDIIDMHLIINESKQELSFYKNGKHLGIAFDTIERGGDITYRLGISLNSKQGQVTMIDFKSL